MNNRIAILIPYFGKWPEWIDLYFYSCSQNTIADWYFMTDCVIPEKRYSNLNFKSCTFSEYCQEVSDKLGIDFKPQNAYKLCDLKPFYGFIHKDILQPYEFWGFADADILWGDIAAFYTNDLLTNYDVFSTHNDRLSGHFSIFRNNKYYRELCFSIPTWEKRLCESINYALDEGSFSKLIYPETAFIGKVYRQVIMKIMDWKTAWEFYYTVFPLFRLFLKLRRKRLYFVEQHTTPILNPDGRLYKYESDTWFYENGVVSNSRTSRKYTCIL